jgi:hypothetical protein
MTGGASGATKYVPAMRKSVEITSLPVDWPGHANAYLITLSPQTEE